MRGGRSLLLLVILAAGLGAYIYFVESERDPLAPETKEKVFAVESGAIERIEIHSTTGEQTTIEKSGDAWRIVAPVATDADDAAASSLADALATTDVIAILEENPTSLAQYGLEPERMSVMFRKTGDPTDYRLKIGRKTPTGSELYAQIEGQPRLILLAGFMEDTLNRTTFDLRDKSVLTFERDAVDRITIEQLSAPRIELARDASEWSLTAPVAARADAASVDSIVSRVEQIRMSAISHEGAEPTSAQLRAFGLDRPRLLATFGAGSTRASLAIGADKDETAVYARDLTRSLVFTVDKSLLADLQKQPVDFRVKDVFAFKSYTATSIDLTHGGLSASFAKQPAAPEASPGPDVWKQTKPETKDVNATAMADLLNTISSLRAEAFATQALASGDDMVVVARFGDASAPTEERVTLRKSGAVVHAISLRDPGAAVVPTADFDKAITQFKALTGAK